MTGKTKQKNENKELREKLARALADYQNLAKRIDREKEEIVARANKNLLKELLPVLDNLEAAQVHLEDQGLVMAINQFKNILEQNGVEEIKTQRGDDFDEVRHEAAEVAEGGEKGKIAEVLRKGYKWKDGMVLRPVQVKVYNNLVN